MNDIFISYVWEDSEWVERLTKAFTLQGWTVWSDSKIPTGKAGRFDGCHRTGYRQKYLQESRYFLRKWITILGGELGYD